MLNQPIKFDFPHKEVNEQVYMTVRRHYFVLMRHSIIFLFFFIFPAIIGGAIYSLNISINQYAFYPIIILILAIYYLFVILFAMIKWIEYYYDSDGTGFTLEACLERPSATDDSCTGLVSCGSGKCAHVTQQ